MKKHRTRKLKPPPKKPENERRRRFVELFMGECHGNATQAYIRAGYSKKGAAQSAHVLLRNPEIRRALEQRVRDCPLVASRKDRQEWWSALMRGDGSYIGWKEESRVNASHLLGKSSGDFVQHHIVDAGESLYELLGGKPLPATAKEKT